LQRGKGFRVAEFRRPAVPLKYGSRLFKTRNTITALTNLLKSGTLSVNDQVAARQMIQQLSDALATKPFGQNP